MSIVLYWIIFAIAILVFCWLLMEYILRDYRDHPKSGKRLPFGTRTAFALTHFWKAVDDAADLPNESIKEDVAGIHMENSKEDNRTPHSHHSEKTVLKGPVQKGKTYRR